MPRKPREFAEKGIYHVFNKGNNREFLFEDVENETPHFWKGTLYLKCDI